MVFDHVRDRRQAPRRAAVNSITYQNGYSHQLARPYTEQLRQHPQHGIETQWLDLSPFGQLTIKTGYAWDGPSGPVAATPDLMRASLVHDALYQMMRLSLLPPSEWKDFADKLLREICLQDGMVHFRAQYIYMAVQHFGDVTADPANGHPLITAPT